MEFEKKTKHRYEVREQLDWEWKEVAEVRVKTVEEVFGQSVKIVVSPWTIGRERGIEGIVERGEEK